MNLKAASDRMKAIALEAGADTVLVALAGRDGNDVWYLDLSGGDLIRLAGVGELLRQHIAKAVAEFKTSALPDPKGLSS
jgi:hypothetical protein